MNGSCLFCLRYADNNNDDDQDVVVLKLLKANCNAKSLHKVRRHNNKEKKDALSGDVSSNNKNYRETYHYFTIAIILHFHTNTH